MYEFLEKFQIRGNPERQRLIHPMVEALHYIPKKKTLEPGNNSLLSPPTWIHTTSLPESQSDSQCALGPKVLWLLNQRVAIISSLAEDLHHSTDSRNEQADAVHIGSHPMFFGLPDSLCHV
jgi:hypothetical protein